jgi:hypothetical protein
VEVFESRAVIASARRWAVVRDACNLLLLASVDAMFLGWPHTHIPLLDRSASVAVLLVINGLSVAYMWSARSVPRWRARHVASTWCPAERNKLINYLEH